jgi:hypothetical protein
MIAYLYAIIVERIKKHDSFKSCMSRLFIRVGTIKQSLMETGSKYEDYFEN